MKYVLMEKMSGSNSETWHEELSRDQAISLGEKSNYDIVKVFTYDKDLKLVQIIKDIPSKILKPKGF